MHREALYAMSPIGIWRIKDDGRRLVPEALKPLSWDGHKVAACAARLSQYNWLSNPALLSARLD